MRLRNDKPPKGSKHATCRVTGCDRPGHGLSPLCSRHGARKAAWGHELARPVVGSILAHWKVKINKLRKAARSGRKGSPNTRAGFAWGDTSCRWGAIERHAYAMETGQIAGGSSYDKKASRYIVEIAKHISSGEAVETMALAMIAMSVAASDFGGLDPAHPAIKRVLKFQLAKGLIRMTHIVNARGHRGPRSPAVRATSWNHKAGRVEVKAYRRIEPQCLEIIGGHLLQMWGELGTLIGEMWKAEDMARPARAALAQKLEWLAPTAK